MATLLSITNKVLKRLREETATDLTTDDYVNLVASFVADITAEVNEAWDWKAYDSLVTLTMVANTAEYTVTGTNNRSTLVYDQDSRAMCWVYDNASDTGGVPLKQVDIEQLEQVYQFNTANTAVNPQYFAVYPSTSNDSMKVRFWPTPATSGVLVKMWVNIPPAELDPDTDAATTILAPERVVRLGALYYALNERGEEIGEAGGIAETRYRMALAAAIETEIRNKERTGYYDAYRI